MTGHDENELSQSGTTKAATFRYAWGEDWQYKRQGDKQDLGDQVLNLIIRNSPNCI